MRSPDNLRQPPEWQWQPRHFTGAWLFYGLPFVRPLLVFSVGMLLCTDSYDIAVKKQQWGRGGAWWLWLRGRWAEIFQDPSLVSSASISSGILQLIPSASISSLSLRPVPPAGSSSQSLAGAVSSHHGPATAVFWPSTSSCAVTLVLSSLHSNYA